MDSYKVLEYHGSPLDVGTNIKLSVDTGDLVAILSPKPPTLKINSTAVIVTPADYALIVQNSETIGSYTLAEYNVQLQHYLNKKHESALLADKYSLAGIMERGVKINHTK